MFFILMMVVKIKCDWFSMQNYWCPFEGGIHWSMDLVTARRSYRRDQFECSPRLKRVNEVEGLRMCANCVYCRPSELRDASLTAGETETDVLYNQQAQMISLSIQEDVFVTINRQVDKKETAFL